ncbi:MAG: hypothetical protein AAGE52_04985 [Myxococcota bacterium]
MRWTLVAMLFAIPRTGHAQLAPEQGALSAAVTDMHETDANGQWFSFTVAAAGVLPGLVLGTMALADGDLLGMERRDGFTQGASIALLTTGAGVIVHGLMRVAERKASAASAAALLEDPVQLEHAGVLYLRNRGQMARSTRLLGGVLTLLHGASFSALGAASLADERDNNIAGYIFVPVGVLQMIVGALHFFGDTHPERLLQGLRGHESRWRITPVAAWGRVARSAGLQLSSRF